MLTVKTRIGPSPIAGIGLFADQDIKKGTVTWRFMATYDLMLAEADIDALPEPARLDILEHAYLDAASGLFILCGDSARFMNHADDPNTAGVHEPGSVECYDVATRDIATGEEMTCDYRTFDAHADVKLGGAR